MYKLIFYSRNNKPLLKDLLEQLRKQDKPLEVGKIYDFLDNLEKYGPKINSAFKPKATKALGDGLFELRPLPNRIFFIFEKNDEIVVLHGFIKTTNKTPPQEIEKAKKEKKEYERSKKWIKLWRIKRES